jgi:DHA1 family bicyclomycin/chloramphenicol resistance-like MFS transporter
MNHKSLVFRSANNPRISVWLLAAIMGTGFLGITIIAPALGAITLYFKTSEAEAQLLLSGFFLSMAISQLIYGPLSDIYGRRPFLLIGLLLYSIGGLVAGFAQSMEMLASARIIQGLGAAAVVSIVRVIINDIYNRLEGAGAFALMSMIMSVVPILSFIFGGIICDLIGWQGTMFLIFISGSLLLIIVVIILPETNFRKNKKFKFISVFHDYISLMKNKNFLAFMLTSSSCAGIFFTMVGFISFEYIRIGVKPAEIGFWFMLNPCGYILGNYITKRYVGKFGIEPMSQLGGFICLISAVLLFLPWTFDLNHPSILGLSGLLLGFASGFVIANTTIGAMSSAGNSSGNASGVVGAAQLGFGILGGTIVVNIGGYEHFERGVLVLVVLSIISLLFATVSRILKNEIVL